MPVRRLVSGGLELAAVQWFRLLSPTNTNYGYQEVGHDTVDANTLEPRVTFRIPPPPDSLR